MTNSTAKFIIGISTASISLFASSTMSFILIRSPTKGLNSPYRRIIFCLSCSDILQSLVGIFGSFAMPKETAASIAPFAMGNRATCAANGFVASNAINFIGMYTCSLCIYYVCKLQWRMSDDKFRARVEWVLHLSVFLVNLPLTLTALALDTYHATSWGFCYYNDKHLECIDGTNLQGGECDVEYDETLWKTFVLIGGIAIPIITYLVIVCCAVLLSRHAILKRREIKLNETIAASGVVRLPLSLRKKLPMRESMQRRAKLQVLSRLYRKETLTQALLFFISFTIIYVFVPFVAQFGNLVGSSLYEEKFKEGVRIVFMCLYPLGGLFNILVYCRPKVAALRRREDMNADKSVSWIRGFFMVVAAGGEIPKEYKNEVKLGSEFKDEDSQLASCYGHSLKRNSVEEQWGANASGGWRRGDGLDWLFGDYYIEEEVLDEIMHARNFDPENISCLSMMSALIEGEEYSD